ncbi:MAG: glycosyltransferase [Candidatus Omnitrophica bacterium]|nr:glycosyltransferase [Candidatus Omnitrophota bacterium]
MENKIKIGYLIGSSEIGGTEKMILTLIRNVDKNLFDFIFFCIKGEGRFTEILKKENYNVYILNFKKNPISFIKLFLYLRKEKLDILQSFLFVSNIIGRIYGRILKINFLISSQRSTDDWRKWYHWLIERMTKNFVDLYISNSYSGREVLIKKGKIKRNKIIVIPNGIELPERFEKIKKDYIVIGSIGNLRRAKGYFNLIKASEIVIKKYKNVKFYIVGEGKLKEEILKIIEKKKLKDYFVLTGYVENVYDYLKIFDIFVLSSLWEGCPLSLLESMGYGIPSIATNVGDVSYIIENGVDGFIVEKNDYRRIAEKIILLIEDENLREKIGEKSREKIKKWYSLEEMIKRYESIYLGFKR